MLNHTVDEALIVSVGKFADDIGGDDFVAAAKDLEIKVGSEKTLLHAMLQDGVRSRRSA
jgi:hypothetical protein